MSALAPAIFLGLQPRPNGKPPIAHFNLTADIPDDAGGSTVSRETLEAAGYLIQDPSAILESPSRRDESPRLSHATVRCSQCGSATPSIRLSLTPQENLSTGFPWGHTCDGGKSISQSNSWEDLRKQVHNYGLDRRCVSPSLRL